VLGNQNRVPLLLALSIYPNWNAVVAVVDVQTVDVAVETLVMAAVRDEFQILSVSFCVPLILFELSVS
jgi:hypothetical protein